MPTATATAGFTRCGARTPDHRREATLLLLLVLQSGAAVAVAVGMMVHTQQQEHSRYDSVRKYNAILVHHINS